MSLKIAEIFASIQGEGYDQGYPAIFIRLYGCSVKCAFCDTKYAWQAIKPRPSTIEEIIEVVKHWIGTHPRIRHIVITGGEPFEQLAGLYKLIEALKTNPDTRHQTVTIETSGTLPVSEMNWEDRRKFVVIAQSTQICLSPKPNRQPDPMFFEYSFTYKLLVDKNGLITQENPNTIVQFNGDLGQSNKYLFLQPVDWGSQADIEAARRKAIELAMEWGCRVSTQIHKILGCK